MFRLLPLLVGFLVAIGSVADDPQLHGNVLEEERRALEELDREVAELEHRRGDSTALQRQFDRHNALLKSTICERINEEYDATSNRAYILREKFKLNEHLKNNPQKGRTQEQFRRLAQHYAKELHNEEEKLANALGTKRLCESIRLLQDDISMRLNALKTMMFNEDL